MTPRGLPRPLAAEYLGISPRTFDAMIEAGQVPPPRLIRSKKVWDRVELDECFEALPRHGDDEGNEWDDPS